MAFNSQSFEYETPQQAQEKLRQRFLQGLQSQGQNPLGQVGYVLGQALAGGFMKNPSVTRAQDTEAAMKQADLAFTESIKDSPPVNDLEKELRRVQILRDKVADVNPEAAAQLNTQLLMLGEAAYQRTRLQASDKREAAQEERAVEMHGLTLQEAKDASEVRHFTGGLTYVLNQQSGKVNGFDLLNPENSKGFQEAASKPGNIVLTPAQMADLNKMKTQESMDLLRKITAAGANVSKPYINGALKASDALLELYNVSDRIFDVFAQNPDALTSTSTGGKKLDSLITELGAASRAVNGETTREGTNINGWLKQNGITNQRMAGLVQGLAYATARANDGSGRISDKDLDSAKIQIGSDNPNPQALLSNMNDNLTTRSNTLKDSLDSLPDEYQVVLDKRRKKLDEKREAFDSKFSEYARGNARPATGIGVGNAPMGTGPAVPPGTPDAEGWTIYNGVKIRRQNTGQQPQIPR